MPKGFAPGDPRAQQAGQKGGLVRFTQRLNALRAQWPGVPTEVLQWALAQRRTGYRTGWKIGEAAGYRRGWEESCGERGRGPRAA